MAGTHNIPDKLRGADMPDEGGMFYIPAIDKFLVKYGSGAPSDSDDDDALIYVRTDGSNGDEVVYTWDDTGSTWDALTA